MKCIRPERRCPFRAYKDGLAFCAWHCPHDIPPSDCPLANETWGCPYLCIYEALENECPFKHELEKTLGERLRKHEEKRIPRGSVGGFVEPSHADSMSRNPVNREKTTATAKQKIISTRYRTPQYVSLEHIPPYDREWIARERCPRCGGKPQILSYDSGDWGCSVEFLCPRCGFRWGADEG